MPKRKKSDSIARREAYNEAYQKKYIRRFVFKLNIKYDRDLISLLENMDNRSEWFREKLKQESAA
ncbi:MAG: hypothetical protein ACI32N_01830 [Bulleidia sp.]